MTVCIAARCVIKHYRPAHGSRLATRPAFPASMDTSQVQVLRYSYGMISGVFYAKIFTVFKLVIFDRKELKTGKLIVFN